MSNDFGSCRKDSRRLVMARLEGTDVFLRPRCEGVGQPVLRDDCNCFVDIPAGCPPLRRDDEVAVILPQALPPQERMAACSAAGRFA